MHGYVDACDIIIVVYIVSHDMIKSVHNEICMIMLLQQIINQHDFQTFT